MHEWPLYCHRCLDVTEKAELSDWMLVAFDVKLFKSTARCRRTLAKPSQFPRMRTGVMITAATIEEDPPPSRAASHRS